MQISFVMLIFPLFLDQISGGKSLGGGQTALGGRLLPPVKESQNHSVKRRIASLKLNVPWCLRPFQILIGLLNESTGSYNVETFSVHIFVDTSGPKARGGSFSSISFGHFHTCTCRLGAQTQPCLKFFGTQKYFPV